MTFNRLIYQAELERKSIKGIKDKVDQENRENVKKYLNKPTNSKTNSEQDKNKPKKPVSAYFLYYQEKIKSYERKNTETTAIISQ